MTAEIRISPSEQKNNTITCRNCKNGLNRIPRSGFVKFFLFGMPLRKYICYKCSRETYRWGSSK